MIFIQRINAYRPPRAGKAYTISQGKHHQVEVAGINFAVPYFPNLELSRTAGGWLARLLSPSPTRACRKRTSNVSTQLLVIVWLRVSWWFHGFDEARFKTPNVSQFSLKGQLLY